MESGKSPGPNDILTEFYVHFWGLIGCDFTHMIHEAVTRGALLIEMNKGLVVLLPKEGDLELLPNFRPITLLNSSYKILAEVLQIRLQKLLPNII